MDAQLNAELTQTQTQVASLLLYQSVFQHPVSSSLVHLLDALVACTRQTAAANPLACLQTYGQWFAGLAQQQQTWFDYVLSRVLLDSNPFTLQASQQDVSQLPPALLAAAQQDLRILQAIAQWQPEHIAQWVGRVLALAAPPIAWHVESSSANLRRQGVSTSSIWQAFHTSSDWGELVEPLACYHYSAGTGLFAEYRAARWHRGQLIGIPVPDPVCLAQLTGYDEQKAALVRNTEALFKGYPALHVLLYGSRGTGKSSLVKALLSEYGDRGLRLIEVSKTELGDLATILETIRTLPQHFIVFVDDLSFEEDEDAYKALKVVLEGNVTARPQNVVVYATSNRRHLIREFFGDRPVPRDADEIHAWDTVQEKLSFSDRFGLTLTFEPTDQDKYLEIVHHLAREAGISLSHQEIDPQALQWATRHNGRSGRTARQFIDYLCASLS
jgi:predicted AAA+ superfamily ATPase